MNCPTCEIEDLLPTMKKRGHGKGTPKFPSLREALETVPKVHGHICTASYLGTRMGNLATKLIKLRRKRDLVAGVEILTCAADGIAAATQCSFGSGRLVFLDHGKFSAIFANQDTGEAIRIKPKPEIDEEHIAYGAQLERFYREYAKGNLEEAMKERKRLQEIENSLIKKWHAMSDAELFIVTRVKVDPEKLKYPLEMQYIPEPVKCSGCGDLTEASRTLQREGKVLCKPCAGEFEIEELEEIKLE